MSTISFNATPRPSGSDQFRTMLTHLNAAIASATDAGQREALRGERHKLQQSRARQFLTGQLDPALTVEAA